ncbi:MAG: EAL domain-containing protein [Planctomycetota bacterium]
MADVAKGMGIKTIAEFVENEEIMRILRDYGVDYAQGYFIGKPAPEIAGMRIG